MAAQPKPLRFLFSKYACQAHEKTQGHKDGRHKLRPFTLPSWGKSGSLSNLHLLSSDVTQSKLERIHLFLALSQPQGVSPGSVDNSSVVTISTQETQSANQRQKDGLGPNGLRDGSPTRFRSKSQEFENMYRLAASRFSPDHLKPQNRSTHQANSAYNSSSFHLLPLAVSSDSYTAARNNINSRDSNRSGQRNTQSPAQHQHYLPSVYPTKREDSAKSTEGSGRGEENLPTRAVLQVMIEERRQGQGIKVTQPPLARPARQLSYSYQDLNDIIGGNYPACRARRQRSFSACRDWNGQGGRDWKGQGSSENEPIVQRVSAAQLPRCPSLSTIDADRVDSACYNHLLDGPCSSDSSGLSANLRPETSEYNTSEASAQALRPSTSNTEATAQRIRNLHTRTTDLSSMTSQTRSSRQPRLPPTTGSILGQPSGVAAPSSSAKSPDLPWPPRYALQPWSDYEDIQALTGKALGGRRGRRSRTRDKSNRQQRDVGRRVEKVHVVPSHSHSEWCNLSGQNDNIGQEPHQQEEQQQQRQQKQQQQQQHQHQADCVTQPSCCPPNTPLQGLRGQDTKYYNNSSSKYNNNNCHVTPYHTPVVSYQPSEVQHKNNFRDESKSTHHRNSGQQGQPLDSYSNSNDGVHQRANKHNINNSKRAEESQQKVSTKPYIPPPTATTHTSLKVNIGIKDLTSSSSNRTSLGEHNQCSLAAPLNNTIPGKSSASKDKKPRIANTPNNSVESFSKSGQLVKRSSRGQQGKSKPSLSFSWDRATNVTLVHETV